MRLLDHLIGPQRSERPQLITSPATIVGQSAFRPNLVVTPVAGRLASALTIDALGNWFITATDGSSESAIGGDYDLEHPFFRVGQPASDTDPNKPPGTIFNINANITTPITAFNVFDVNVYSNSASQNGHYAGQFTGYSGPLSSGAGALGINCFNDNAAAGSHGITVGVASSVVISGGDVGGVQIIVGQHGATPRAVDYALHIGSRGVGMSFDKAIRLDDSNVISAAGTIFGLRNATRLNCAWGIDFNPNAGVTDATFSGGAFRSTGFTVVGSGRVDVAFASAAPGMSITSTTGTNRALMQFTNAAGNAFLGIDGSVGGLFTGIDINSLVFGISGGVDLEFATNNVKRLRISANGSIIPGNAAALATTATDGYLYTQSCAGAPTGVPTAFAGRVPIHYDTTNNRIYAYNGAWRSVAVA